MILFFVGVGRGRGGRERFTGGGEEEEGDNDVPLTTAAIVSEIAKKKNQSNEKIHKCPYNHVFSVCRRHD